MKLSRFNIRDYCLPLSVVIATFSLTFLPFAMSELGFNFETLNVHFKPSRVPFVISSEFSSAISSTQQGVFVWTMVHWTAFCLAGGTAILAVVCHVIRREPILLIMAGVLFIVGLMDVFHTLFLDFLVPEVCAPPEDHLAFPWFMGRLTYALLPLLAITIASLKKTSLHGKKWFAYGYFVFACGWGVLLGVIVLNFCYYPDSFPDVFYPSWVVAKPLAGVPLLLFLISIPVFVSYFKKFPSRYSHGLLISLVPSIGAQLYMFASRDIFDGYSNMASIVKMVAYAVIFVAICLDYIFTFRANKEFVSIMSHEMRNPLHAALGITDCLQQGMDGPLNEKQKDSLTKIASANQQMLVLVNDILDMSKVEAGKVQLFVDQVDLIRVIRESVQILEDLAKQKGLTLTAHMPWPTYYIQGDEQKLKQILLNLVGNAIKYTEQGGITIGINETLKEVRIEVQDTGVGLTERQIEQIFKPYYQALPSDVQGTGIGLMLSKNFAQLHFGDITVKSKKEKGSTFTLTLPKGVQWEKS